MLALQARLDARPDVAPTFDELRLDLGLASKSSISRLLAGCEERGRIKRLAGRQRAIAVLSPVTMDEALATGDLMKSFSDRELMNEVSDRGLIRLSA